MVGRRTRCVTVDYANDFHVDVVPYLERHGEKFITNRADDGFELTNPEGFNAWLDEKNRTTGGRLVKVIRLQPPLASRRIRELPGLDKVLQQEGVRRLLRNR